MVEQRVRARSVVRWNVIVLDFILAFLALAMAAEYKASTFLLLLSTSDLRVFVHGQGTSRGY